MAEGCANSRPGGNEIKTLEETLSRFGLPCLLQDLDESLMHVRHHKKAKDEHLQCLKVAEKRLLKLSISYHPDRIVKTDKPDTEVAKSQELQAALNATRTVLLALTEVFLEHIDIDYKYEFFSKLEINILLSDEERKLVIGRLSNRLRKIKEVKQLVVIREIRKFLLKSRKCIKSFMDHDVSEFERNRDHAVYHLEKCTEGYKTLASECSNLERESKDSCVKFAIQKAAQQNASESNILCELLEITRRSLGGTFLIFSIRGPTDEFEYFVLPFAYHVFIQLMCTLMVDRKMYIKGKNYTIEPPYYEKEPDMYLTAYYLACYFNDRNLCGDEVEHLLRERNLPTTQINVVEAFHDNLKKIDCFLAEEFKIDHYDAGKTDEEQFNDRLTRLTEATTEIEEVVKNLSEKISQCRMEYEEIKRENFKRPK